MEKKRSVGWMNRTATDFVVVATKLARMTPYARLRQRGQTGQVECIRTKKKKEKRSGEEERKEGEENGVEGSHESSRKRGEVGGVGGKRPAYWRRPPA